MFRFGSLLLAAETLEVHHALRDSLQGSLRDIGESVRVCPRMGAMAFLTLTRTSVLVSSFWMTASFFFGIVLKMPFISFSETAIMSFRSRQPPGISRTRRSSCSAFLLNVLTMPNSSLVA